MTANFGTGDVPAYTREELSKAKRRLAEERTHAVIDDLFFRHGLRFRGASGASKLDKLNDLFDQLVANDREADLNSLAESVIGAIAPPDEIVRRAHRLDTAELRCEVCGEYALIGRVVRDVVGKRTGSVGFLRAGSEEDTFWACDACHARITEWSIDQLSACLAESRTKYRPPLSLSLSLVPESAASDETGVTASSVTPPNNSGPPHPGEPAGEAVVRSPLSDDEKRVGVSFDQLAALFVIDSIKGFGPQKHKELFESRIAPADVIRAPERLPTSGKVGALLRDHLRALTRDEVEECRERARYQIHQAAKLGCRIVTYGDELYPRPVFRSNNPIPVLYARGHVDVLRHELAVACVGSREIREPYTRLHTAFARSVCELGWTVASGFASGADRVGHETAFASSGRTVAVMPCGVDRPFPPENRDLWDDLLKYRGAVFVSEFAFGVRASSMTLRKRNKLIVAFAAGVLVSQSSNDGGAMNAYRFAKEQRKPVATFRHDDTEQTSGNLAIAEGGTAFSSSRAEPEQYQRWIRGLSSST